MYKITQIPLQDVLLDTKRIKYNVNNLSYIKPSDYDEICATTNTNQWITNFHNDNYNLIKIQNSYDINWIKEATKIGKITGKFSEIYREDLDELAVKFEKYFPCTKYFVRTEHASLKEGIHGIGPYNTFHSIIESICTSSPMHYCVNKDR